MAIAPTLIASVAVTQQAVPASRLTEALSWNSTGIAAGLALGAAGVGRLIDDGGANAGLAGVVGAGAALIVSVVFVRSRRPVTEPAVGPELRDSAGAPPPHFPAKTP
jgi:predicted MFS family arabinose efflux permease